MKTARLCWLITILLMGLLACSDPDEPGVDENLLGIVWKVDTLQALNMKIVRGPDNLIEVTPLLDDSTLALHLPDSFLTIVFTEKMTIAGILADNTYHGSYVITVVGTVEIDILGWTEKLGIYWLERLFTDALEQVDSYVLADDRLRLYDSSRTYLISFSPE